MTNHTTFTIPGRQCSMRMQSEHIIMGGRLNGTMALCAGIFGVADTARCLILHPEFAMPLRPKRMMILRGLIGIHIGVACQTVLTRTMCFIPNIHDISTL